MTRKRSKYRPRFADPAAAARRLLRASRDPLQHDQLTDLALMHSMALADLLHGKATPDSMAILGSIANMALLMAEAGMGAEEIPSIKAAMLHLLSIERRHRERGNYVATGEEITSIRGMVETHQAQLESEDCDSGFVMRALDEVRNRALAGHIQTA